MSNSVSSAFRQYPETLELNGAEWRVLHTDNQIQLLEVKKEIGTHGFIYLLAERSRSTCWVGQSIPVIVHCVNYQWGAADQRHKLHASSLYRILRSEARSCFHKNFKIQKFPRTDLLNLNEVISKHLSVFWITKAPDNWVIELKESS